MTDLDLAWNVDGWYSDRRNAEVMRDFYLEQGAIEAHVVTHSVWGSFGIVYSHREALADWHRMIDP